MNSKKLVLIAVVLAAFAPKAWSQDSGAPGPTYTEVIMDASGSMLAEVKNEAKIETAKKMLTGFIRSTEQQQSLVAVRTFGNRTGKCDDIQLKLGFYAKDESRLAAVVGEINPKNQAKTPLAKAMEQSYENLKKQNGAKNLVVFTDGVETCGGDPCKIAAKLKKDINVKIYVVAYGVTNQKEFRELQCMADDSDATAPKNPDQLGESLADIRKKIRQSKQSIIIKGPDPTSPATAIDKEKRAYPFIAGVGIDLPPGTYDVRVDFSTTYWFRGVQLKPKQVKVLKVNGSGGIDAKFRHPLMKVVALNVDTSNQYPMNDKGTFDGLPPGRYSIAARTASGLAYQWPVITIVPNARSVLSPPPWGSLRFRSDGKVAYRIFRQGGARIGGGAGGSLEKTEDPFLPVKRLITEREPEAHALTNEEVLLEEGTYVLVFANGAIENNVKLKRGQTLVLPP